MDEEQKKFSNEVNVDRAKTKVNAAIGLILISLLTYIPALLLNDFDFGIIFEGTSFVMVIIARICLSNYNAESAKACLIVSFLSVGWLFIYDIFRFVVVFLSSSYIYGYSYWFYISEVLTFSYLALLANAIMSLSKAIDPISNRETTDWFYETLDKDEKNN